MYLTSNVYNKYNRNGENITIFIKTIYKNYSKSIRKGSVFLKFDNGFKEIKIRHIISMYLIMILILIAIIIGIYPAGEISNTNINILCLIMESLCAIVLCYMIKPSKGKINSLYSDFKTKLNLKEIILVIIFFVCLNMGAKNIMTDIIYLISPSFANSFINDSTLIINSKIDYWMVFIILVILTPFTEEIVFRYVFFKRLSKKFNIYVGLIVSSIIFAAFTNGSGPEFIGFLLLGIINCILYVKYENILIPMFIYFVNNVFYMIASIPFGKAENEAINLNLSDMIFYAVSGGVLFTIGMIFFIKFISENKVYLREAFDKSKVMEVK